VLCCLTYLSLTSLDGLFQDSGSGDTQTLKERLLRGDYTFFQYASHFWLQHIRDLASTQREDTGKTELKAVTQAAERFYESRGRMSAGRVEAGWLRPEFRLFSQNLKLQRSLAISAKFSDRLQYEHAAISEGA